ncbi:MAG: hypothetical protein JJ863_14630 [Deltaproteobacteria bacterium]|nr:hypothetical protein [Deltaproteobacteria bacterium]
MSEDGASFQLNQTLPFIQDEIAAMAPGPQNGLRNFYILDGDSPSTQRVWKASMSNTGVVSSSAVLYGSVSSAVDIAVDNTGDLLWARTNGTICGAPGGCVSPPLNGGDNGGGVTLQLTYLSWNGVDVDQETGGIWSMHAVRHNSTSRLGTRIVRWDSSTSPMSVSFFSDLDTTSPWPAADFEVEGNRVATASRQIGSYDHQLDLYYTIGANGISLSESDLIIGATNATGGALGACFEGPGTASVGDCAGKAVRHLFVATGLVGNRQLSRVQVCED